MPEMIDNPLNAEQTSTIEDTRLLAPTRSTSSSRRAFDVLGVADADEDTGEEMLKWVKEKRTNLTTNYKNVQVFFKDELDCQLRCLRSRRGGHRTK